MTRDFDPVTRDQWVCSVCRRPLDVYQKHDAAGTVIDFDFLHAIADSADHDPVPVRLDDTGGEIVGKCDFCSAPHPAWRYPCRDFAGTDTPYGSVGDWAACAECHRLIERGYWSKLAARAVASYPPGLRGSLRGQVAGLHMKFVAHRDGPAVPL